MNTKLPTALVDELSEKQGFESASFIDVHENGEQITSIRLNPAKAVEPEMGGNLIPWTKNGLYLKERPVFTADPLFHAGCYYVQEASSMFLEEALKQTVDLDLDIKVLDLCAAPGGKSTLINSLISDGSLLLANEIIKSRVLILCNNLIKWGKPNAYVCQNDPRDFGRLPGYFDALVVDAPCSGSGMFRKDPAAINEWSEDAVVLCSQRQQRILADVYPALKKDGVLIYSTCSYSELENEAIADWLTETFDLESIRLEISADWGIVETQSEQDKNWGYRFYPNRVKGEGFFLACFRKREEQSAVVHKTRRNSEGKLPAGHLEEIRKWLNPDFDMVIKTFNDTYLAIPVGHDADFQIFQDNLYLKKSGIRIGKFAGKDFIPDHELALSVVASPNIPRINLSREQALAYLKRMDISFDTPLTGWALMCFEDFPLGWAKVLPKRVNNYYPKEWRIVNQSIS